MRDIRVASVQFEHTAGDKAANLARVESCVEQAAGHAVKLIVFPECCITGYWFLRGLSRGQFFSQDGVLVASTAQEGLVRVVDERRERSNPRHQR